MLTLFKRDLRSLFITASGYVFLAVYLLLSATLFFVGNVLSHSTDLSHYFQMTSYLWLLLVPILAMRAYAGDEKHGTSILLKVSPLTDWQIIIAKFFSCAVVLCLSVTLSCAYLIIPLLYGKLFWGELLLGLLGMTLYGLAYLGLSLWVTLPLASPTAAFTLSFGANLLLRFLSIGQNPYTSVGLIKKALSFFMLEASYHPFLDGQLSLAATLHFIAFILFTLIGSLIVYDVKKRRRG